MKITKKIIAIASDTLDIIVSVGNRAIGMLDNSNSPEIREDQIAAPNTWTNPERSDFINRHNIGNEKIVISLASEPVIGRVDYIDDDNGEEQTLYITSVAPPFDTFGQKFASYHSKMGRILAFEPGDSVGINLPRGNISVEVLDKVLLNPEKVDGEWDSTKNQFFTEDGDKFTIHSLRNLSLEISIETDKLDIKDVDSLWEMDDDNIEVGFRKSVLEKMSLRKQLVLDKTQDRIFRMPINSQCFLSGPPGTGKTTTLIHRLSQKTKIFEIGDYEDEERLVSIVNEETDRPHEFSWLMFSPTELLRQYVKEAFNRERIAAPDDNIQTWDKFSLEVARNWIGILKSGTGSGQFVHRDKDILKSESFDQIEWYNDFLQYLDEENVKELETNAVKLSKIDDADIIRISKELSSIVSQMKKGSYSDGLKKLDELRPVLSDKDTELDTAINKILISTRNRVSIEDNEFPEQLKEKLETIIREVKSAQTPINEDSEDEELDDLTEPEDNSGLSVNIERAQKLYFQAIKVAAKSKLAGRKRSKKSQNGLLIEWLGQDRLPSEEELISLGKLLSKQSQIRKFLRIQQFLLSSVARLYKRFRITRSKVGKWYNDNPIDNSDITRTEIDLLILVIFQLAQEILNFHRQKTDAKSPNNKILRAVRDLQRAQIVVDEATDFSVLQLACMYEIAHPSLNSFFMCGDFNQRLTKQGIKSSKELDWIAPQIIRESITMAYRQSKRLVDLAESIAELSGVDKVDTDLPERLDSTGYKPVWQNNLSNLDSIAKWVSQRIREVNGIYNVLPTIGILVNQEEYIDQLVDELENRLEDINISVEGCKDGRVIGDENAVRVFNIQHIKGLEFESAFFISLDETIEMHPDLFSKYLYVGATRAANFLGVTFRNEIPAEVQSLEPHFGENWISQD